MAGIWTSVYEDSKESYAFYCYPHDVIKLIGLLEKKMLKVIGVVFQQRSHKQKCLWTDSFFKNYSITNS